MVFFNYSTMQMAAKVVYYGPGLCGKTTNLQWIFDHTSNDSRGEMVSLATETDRTLFFDLLPIDVGSIAGFSTRIQLYTVPGQVFYNTTRKLVLKGVDGVVFVADSQRPMLQANIESLHNLEENLAEMGLSLDTIPVVLQYNKRDLPGICSVEELDQALNRNSWPSIESSAINGTGVFETLKMVSKMTLLALKKRLTKSRPETGTITKTGSASKTGSVSKTGTATKTGTTKRPLPPPKSSTEIQATPKEAPAPSPTPPDPTPSKPATDLRPEVSALGDIDLEETLPATSPRSAELRLARQKADEVKEEKSEKVESQKQVEAAEPPPVAKPEPMAEAPPAPAIPEPSQEVQAESPEPQVPTPAVETSPAPRPKAKSSRHRATGIDALAELEKIRKQTLKKREPKAPAQSVHANNGKGEISRSLQLRLSRKEFQQAKRFSLTLKLEDQDQNLLDEVHQLHVNIDDAASLEKLLLRLNIALDPGP